MTAHTRSDTTAPTDVLDWDAASRLAARVSELAVPPLQQMRLWSDKCYRVADSRLADWHCVRELVADAWGVVPVVLRPDILKQWQSGLDAGSPGDGGSVYRDRAYQEVRTAVMPQANGTPPPPPVADLGPNHPLVADHLGEALWSLRRAADSVWEGWLTSHLTNSLLAGYTTDQIRRARRYYGDEFEKILTAGGSPADDPPALRMWWRRAADDLLQSDEGGELTPPVGDDGSLAKGQPPDDPGRRSVNIEPGCDPVAATVQSLGLVSPRVWEALKYLTSPTVDWVTIKDAEGKLCVTENTVRPLLKLLADHGCAEVEQRSNARLYRATPHGRDVCRLYAARLAQAEQEAAA